MEVKDLYNIEEDMSAQFLHKRWEKAWSPVMQKYHKKLQNAQEVVKHEIVDRNEDSSVIVTADDTVPLIKTRKKSSHYGATINHEGGKNMIDSVLFLLDHDSPPPQWRREKDFFDSVKNHKDALIIFGLLYAKT